jgi:vitamin B12 transporter
MSSFRQLRRTIAAFLPCSLLLAAPEAGAQDRAIVLRPITITATRLPTPENEVGSTVTVITAEEIERKQHRTISDVLREVPGLNLVQSGGPGAFTSVFTRGTNPNHTLVRIDGIEVGDPSTPTGDFDFAHLLVSDVDRIEVLRGPQSGLYGANALGGVIDVRTRKGSGKPQFTGTVEGGSFETFNQFGSVRGAHGPFDYSLAAGHFSAGDIPVTPRELLPPGTRAVGNDYENATFATKLGYEFAKGVEVGLSARYIDTDLRFTGDDFDLATFTFVPSGSQSRSESRQLFTRAWGRLVSFDGRLDQTFGVGFTDYRRRDVAPTLAPMINKGDRTKLDWIGNVKVIDGQTLTLGAEHEVEQIHDSPISAETTTSSGLLQLQSNFADRVYNTASVRYDSSDRFENRTTFRVAPAVAFDETGTTLKGSVGTGFKAPSLNQLFVDFPAFLFFANPNLKPEKSVGYDIGFEQEFWERRLRFGATYFRNDIDDLIMTAPFPGGGLTNVNVAKATSYGVETFVAVEPIETVTARLDYTYTAANDDRLDQELRRRPKHKASLSAAWIPFEKASLTGTAIFVGDSVDSNRNFTVLRQETKPYVLVNLSASYDVLENLRIFGRIDNLLDRDYQLPTGFRAPGLGAFGGIRATF